MQASRWAPQASPDPPATSTSTYADDATPFAQTGGETNDLFSDDFTPIAQPVSQPVPPEAPRSNNTHFQNPRGTRDARRARGRGRGGRAVPPPVTAQVDDKPAEAVAEQDHEVKDEGNEAALNKSNDKANAAVRGDRSQTGGISRPRLTEDELTAKLEAVRLNNARREEAHRAAEEDEASFRAQEAQAQERRQEDALNRKRMEAEREKNRARKLAGRGGREWDEGKEEDTGRGRGRGYRRGANGAVTGGLAASMHGGSNEFDEGEIRYGRQRGDYSGRPGGGGRGRARGRGASDAGAAGREATAPPSLGDANFPALGGAKQDGTTQKGQDAPGEEGTAHDLLDTPAAGGRARHGRSPWRVTDEPKTSWADQVEEGV